MGETDRLVEIVRGRNAKTVGLQFPVGLRTKAVELAQEIEAKAGVTCIVSADPSFGACDVPEMPVDLIVHLGHAPMPQQAGAPSPSTSRRTRHLRTAS